MWSDDGSPARKMLRSVALGTATVRKGSTLEDVLALPTVRAERPEFRAALAQDFRRASAIRARRRRGGSLRRGPRRRSAWCIAQRRTRPPSALRERHCMNWFRLPTLLSWCVFVLAPWGFARCPGAQDPKLAAAIPAIHESIRKSGADVGVAFRTLDGGVEWFFRADKPL